VSSFDRLHPSLQHHLVNTLGWAGLRPLQQASIPPILDGDHVLVTAPTAGGKTESAIVPLISRILTESWQGTSVLYVCPLKALLNNLHVRLSRYLSMVGLECGIWHGDITETSKRATRRGRPACILITPESMEAMLISAKPDSRELLREIRAVLIDEVHAFARDDRGWHLLCVLERIARLSGRELQRIGLSATIGNPESVLEWMAGHCEGNRTAVSISGSATGEPEVTLDYVGTLENAASVIATLYPNEKRLVFCDSRGRVEKLAMHLRGAGVKVYVSHSSLSAERRREAEQAFSEGDACVILATSTLELGIDVGDLDRVIQIDAPGSVASFLQRLGRTGRRPGTSRNCLFLATTQNALLQAAALIDLWRGGYVEPIEPPRQPLHILAQQFLALSLQEKRVAANDISKWLGRLPVVRETSAATWERVIMFLTSEGIVFADQGLYSIGVEGEVRFGRKHFLELVSVFASPSLLRVMHGREEVGTVDPASLSARPGQPLILSLGGHCWEVVHVDWRERLVFVKTSNQKGRSLWLGSRPGMPFIQARTVRKLLSTRGHCKTWSRRAKEAMDQARAGYEPATTSGATFRRDPQTAELHVWTFAGGPVNSLLSEAAVSLLKLAAAPAIDNFRVTFPPGVNATEVTTMMERMHRSENLAEYAHPSTDVLKGVKFWECLPPDLAREVFVMRNYDLPSTRVVLNERLASKAGTNGEAPV